MNWIQSLNLIDAAQLAIIGVLCSGITQAVKANNLLPAKYMPFVSMGLGVVISALVALIFKDSNIGQAILAGLLVGGFTAGLFNGVKGVTGGYEVKSGEETK